MDDKRIMKMKNDLRRYTQVVYRISLTNECNNCGASVGNDCKPEYGCNTLARASQGIN